MLKLLKTKIIKLSISVSSLLICSTIFAEHRILVFGDSLSNAYGIEKRQVGSHYLKTGLSHKILMQVS